MALEPATRAAVERRFHHDFSKVRIHADVAAAESAREVNALAYTVANHVVFGADLYAPRTSNGMALLVHELTHVAQQHALSPIPSSDVRIQRPDDSSEIQANAVAAGTDLRAEGTAFNGSPVLQRQTADAAPVTAKDARQLVQDTIQFFQQSADFYRLAEIDGPRFNRIIDSWHGMISDREQLIDDRLDGDAALRQGIREAYVAAIRILLARTAAAQGRDESDLYRENSGRIPMWAWQVPHHLEAGISTPIEDRLSASPATGEVSATVGDFQVMIAPDGADPTLGDHARTHFDIQWGAIDWQTQKEHNHTTVISVTGPGPATVRIQTYYGPGVTSSSPSAYGRGTTSQDIAGARVTPGSGTVGFHEGSHGLDIMAFLAANPAPHFTGAVGMTLTQINAAAAEWKHAIQAYRQRAERFTVERTDCVGTSIDQFSQAHAPPHSTITLVCGP